MSEVSPLVLYDVATATLATVMLVYLLYSGRYAVAYVRFLKSLAIGLLAFFLVANVLTLLPSGFPSHALVGLFVLPALALLVRSWFDD